MEYYRKYKQIKIVNLHFLLLKIVCTVLYFLLIKSFGFYPTVNAQSAINQIARLIGSLGMQGPLIMFINAFINESGLLLLLCINMYYYGL